MLAHSGIEPRLSIAEVYAALVAVEAAENVGAEWTARRRMWTKRMRNAGLDIQAARQEVAVAFETIWRISPRFRWRKARHPLERATAGLPVAADDDAEIQTVERGRGSWRRRAAVEHTVHMALAIDDEERRGWYVDGRGNALRRRCRAMGIADDRIEPQVAAFVADVGRVLALLSQEHPSGT